MRAPSALRRSPWFVLLVVCGQALGYAACRLLGATPLAAWGALIVVALPLGGLAVLLLDRTQAPDTGARQAFERALADKSEQQRKLRHDIRGALSPVLLVADRLLNHADPAVKRSGEIMVRTVDRATALLTASGEAEANPPADP